jgi:hypothetical protein
MQYSAKFFSRGFPTVYDAQVTMLRDGPNFIVDRSPAPWHKVSPHKYQPNLIFAPILRLKAVSPLVQVSGLIL